MKYYLIVGEASGDLHASRLMAALKQEDPKAEFRFYGGDLMAAQGGTLVKHYREMAYMGFIPVLLHLRTIFANMKLCKQDIISWSPDVVILVDYPGFNLDIAKFVHSKTNIPVYYYISPKIWAWKEYRIKNIKRDVDQMYSILPFEVEFYNKHNYPINYVGNPTLDEVCEYKENHNETFAEFINENGLDNKPIIALLSGSRKQEIKDNLTRMLSAASEYSSTHNLVIAGAPGISPDFYKQYIKDYKVDIIFNRTYALLQHSDAALVTSGTATLETALFDIPQVVCYYIPAGKFISVLRKLVLKVKFISLVNLVAGREIVKELVADTMTVNNIKKELNLLLNDKDYRDTMENGYKEVRQKLGTPGAPRNASKLIIKSLKR